MKSTLTTLTFLVAALAIAPRHSYGQYAWVPVYSEPAAVEAYNSAPGQSGYATYVGEELEDFAAKEDDNDKGCKSDCECPRCRNAGWLSRTFGGVEYLHWYQKGSRLPPLVTEGTAGAAINLPGTELLFGGNFVGNDRMAGLRVTGGLWLDECKSRAVVVRAFGSEGASTPFSKNAPTAGFPHYGIPFWDTFPPAAEDGFRVAQEVAGAPDIVGTIGVQASTDVFGGDAMYKTLLDEGCDYRFDLLAGYQYSKIDDDLVVSTTSTFPFATNDVFDVSNQFNAATLGLSGDFNHGPVTFQLMGKLGIGNMRQTVGITGNHVSPGAVPGDGGFFAQPPNGGQPFNIGEHSRDVFTFSPEANAKMIWCLKDNFSISVGYTFIYWNRVAMAGDQIDRRTLDSTGSVNSSVIFDGPFAGSSANANPRFVFRDADFFVHTIDIGGMFKY
ncbi:MAG: BBP7 family outer membrane beta-barrel protein [Planctomycetota bacterium]|nr:BBP7 family outer membrane beta-barrel protein [Planctomycetota bacterium]